MIKYDEKNKMKNNYSIMLVVLKTNTLKVDTENDLNTYLNETNNIINSRYMLV